MKVGVNGAVRDISDLKVGANGAVQQASELWIGVNGATKKVWPILPVGTEFIIDSVGQTAWTCPVSGLYSIELHGGGGGGGGGNFIERSFVRWDTFEGAGGGGSGLTAQAELTKGNVYTIIIGKGGTAGDAGPGNASVGQGVNGGAGSSSSFGGTYLVSGGTGGQGDETETNNKGGSGAGNIGLSGADGKSVSGTGPSAYDGALGGSGGGKYGGTYGKGGNGGGISSRRPSAPLPGKAGANGACIITYLG